MTGMLHPVVAAGLMLLQTEELFSIMVAQFYAHTSTVQITQPHPHKISPSFRSGITFYFSFIFSSLKAILASVVCSIFFLCFWIFIFNYVCGFVPMRAVLAEIRRRHWIPEARVMSGW